MQQWSKLQDDFLAHVLTGADNGIDEVAPVYTMGRQASGAGYGSAGTNVEQAWPPVGTQDVKLFLRRGTGNGVLTTSGKPSDATATFVDAAAGDEVRALETLDAETDFLSYVSPPLTADTRIAGEALLDAALTVNRDRGSFTPILVDIDENGARTAARGFMNLQYRNGLEKAEPLPAGKRVNATAIMKPQDYTFGKGHRIGVVLLASNVAWVRPDVPGQSTTVHHGAGPQGTSLTLPVVAPPADPAELFEQPAQEAKARGRKARR